MKHLVFKIIGVIIPLSLMSIVDIPGLIKNKQLKELFIYLFIFILGLVLTLLHLVFRIDLTKVTEWLIKAFS